VDFSLTKKQEALQKHVRDFVMQEIIPYERDVRQFPDGPDESLRLEIVNKARDAGFRTPHISEEWGGMGLDHRDKAIFFEAAGYSPLGPIALNCAAPDEGNMHLLEAVATEEQKKQYLLPMSSGQIRSCFCMTEPAGGAGSDPSLMKTTAIEDGDDFVINGAKWLITGAVDARFAIIMASTKAEGIKEGAATMFLADMSDPAIEIERIIRTNDNCFSGGHAIVNFNDLRVSRGDVLGELGQGFKYAQVRLAPARLTHCMRWLGAAQRCHDIALAYSSRRTAFGKYLADHEGIGFMLADNEMDLHVCRMTIWHTAWLLDQGEQGGFESSRAKVICSEAQFRIVDRAVQILGGMGVTEETIVERLFREIRGFRVYDGPSEVHRWSMAKKLKRHAQGADFIEETEALDLPFTEPGNSLFIAPKEF